MPRLLIVFLAVGISGFGQISFPGSGGVGFPGQRRPGQNDPNGPYDPSQQYPGGNGGIGGRRGRNQPNQPPETVDGTIRSNANSEMVIESEDHLKTTVMLSGVTKFTRIDGTAGKRADFKEGDHVSIEGTVDDRANFRALRVKLVKLASAEDKAAPASASSIGSDDDADRPRLRRAQSPDPPAQAAPPIAAQIAPQITPQIVQGDPSVHDAPVAAAAPDPDDPGRPILRRGGTLARATEPVAATSAPAAAASPVATARAAGRAPENDTVIAQTREAALAFSDTLPSYVVKQYTTRYTTEMAKGGKTSWNALDSITADVVAEDGKETYKNILINGKKPKEDPEKSGAWSSGEFSSMLLDVLSPQTDADFHGKRTSTIGTRSAWRYDYSVQQQNSHWHITASAQSYIPAYSGSIWIDKETFRALRIEMSAKGMPKTFELDTIESAVDYDNVMIGDRKFMVPVHSEVMNCQRGTSNCSRNVIEFRNYRKFGADTSISFEPNQ